MPSNDALDLSRALAMSGADNRVRLDRLTPLRSSRVSTVLTNARQGTNLVVAGNRRSASVGIGRALSVATSGSYSLTRNNRIVTG